MQKVLAQTLFGGAHPPLFLPLGRRVRLISMGVCVSRLDPNEERRFWRKKAEFCAPPGLTFTQPLPSPVCLAEKTRGGGASASPPPFTLVTLNFDPLLLRMLRAELNRGSYAAFRISRVFGGG